MKLESQSKRRSRLLPACLPLLHVSALILGSTALGCFSESSESEPVEPVASEHAALSVKPLITDAGAPNVCSAACLGGKCPNVFNVRNCLTAACKGVVPGGPTSVDDYQLLSNAAAFIAANPGQPGTPTTMVYPPGSYNIKEYVKNITNAPSPSICPTPFNGVTPISFGSATQSVHDFALIGCSDANGNPPVINANGNFTRTADYQSDVGPVWISCEDSVTPFALTNATNFTISNFDLNGNNQSTVIHDEGCDTGTCTKYIAEGNGYGIYTTASSNYTLSNLKVHNMGTDGLYLGNGDVNHPDRFATVTQVDISNNGRDALSIGQLQYSSFNDVSFHASGKPCANGICGPAAYLGYAGVDIEPNIYNPFAVYEVQFNSCKFFNNRGAAFSTVMPNEVKEVSFSSCSFVDQADPLYPVADPTHAKYFAAFGIAGGTIDSSTFDSQTGAIIQLGATWPPPPAVATASTVTLKNSFITVYQSTYGVAITDGYFGQTPYTSVSIINTLMEDEFGLPPNSASCTNCTQQVHPFIELFGNTNFVSNGVVVDPMDYPTTNPLYLGGNPVISLSAWHADPNIHVFSALNNITTQIPWSLGANTFYEVAYGGSEVCNDSFTGGIKPTTTAANVGPPASGPNPYVQNCGCSASATLDQVFVPTSAAGGGHMVGCGGAVTWNNRANLCGAGAHVCSSAEWDASRGTTAPTVNYWTNDNLGYSGTGTNACEAILGTAGTPCPVNEPMHVCSTNQPDTHGNACTWTGCGLQTTQNQYFGGCYGDTTAGTLCCEN